MASPSDDVSTRQETQDSKVPAIHPGRPSDTRLSSSTRSITSGDPTKALRLDDMRVVWGLIEEVKPSLVLDPGRALEEPSDDRLHHQLPAQDGAPSCPWRTAK